MTDPQAQFINDTDSTKPMLVTINAERFVHDGDPELPLLWYLRDDLQLTGTKYGCDSRSCGACTVLVDGKAALACGVAMSTLDGAAVTTVEGLADQWRAQHPEAASGNDGLHPLQQAFIDKDAIQCGYCQPGQLMAAAAMLASKPEPGETDLDNIDNLCRCGIYPRIRAAIKQAAAVMRETSA